MVLHNRKVAIFGERDDITALSIRKCVEAAGAEVVYETTSCFVWTAAGAAGLAEQEQIKQLAEQFSTDQLIVVLGLNQPENLRVMATTFRDGDPSFAGALAGVAMGLKSYHIFELKDEIPPDVWSAEMAMEELEIEDHVMHQILATMREVRQEWNDGAGLAWQSRWKHHDRRVDTCRNDTFRNSLNG